jgi:hypothetical protein
MFAPAVSLARCPPLAFAVCRRLVSGEAPAQQQRSTSRGGVAAAVPQYISGRTSYLRVRLAFHPYPQLIRAFCNRHRCGPPRPVRDASAWPWVAHTVSGLSPATVALFRLAFTPAPAGTALTTPPRITRRIILQKARGHRCFRLPRRGSTRFQGLFHSPHRGAFHRSLTVLCAIGHCV